MTLYFQDLETRDNLITLAKEMNHHGRAYPTEEHGRPEYAVEIKLTPKEQKLLIAAWSKRTIQTL